MSSIGKVRRLLKLLERLQSGKTHSARELSELCDVSRRTVFRDLKTLGEAGVQVLYDSSRQGYWIPTQSFLPPTELTLAETLSLLILAQEAGSKERGVPFQESARDAALKLQSNLPQHLAQNVSEFSQALKIDVEPQADLRNGREHYERLLDAIPARKKVRLRYGSLAEEKEIRTLLSPYQLLFRRHAWYAIGRSSVHRAVRTFHLGRITESEVVDETFDLPPRFTLKRYLGKAWNLIRERNARVEVCIRFQPMVARNVAEVCWHSTRRLVWNDDGTLDFSVTVDGIHEISWWILSYGDQACVLRPQTLSDLIRDRARTMVRQYEERP